MKQTIQELVVLSQKDMRYTEELWARLAPLCMSWSNKLKNLDYSTEDLYQETYLLLIKSLNEYQITLGVKFESYFKLILYRWGTHYIDKKRECLTWGEDHQDFFDRQADNHVDVEAQIVQEEQVHILIKALQILTPSEYQLIIDFYVKQERIIDISLRCGLNHKAVESKKRRIIKKMKKYFDAF